MLFGIILRVAKKASSHNQQTSKEILEQLM